MDITPSLRNICLKHLSRSCLSYCHGTTEHECVSKQGENVIRTVINRLTNKKIDRLPSKDLCCQLFIEARHLADIQVGKAVLEGLDMSTVLGNALHGDGTTKYHRHFQNCQIPTSDDESLTASLMEIVGKKGYRK